MHSNLKTSKQLLQYNLGQQISFRWRLLLLLEKHSSFQIILAASHKGWQQRSRVKLLRQILALGCSSFPHCRSSLHLGLQGTSPAGGGAGPMSWLSLHAVESLLFPSWWLCSFEEPSANSGTSLAQRGSELLSWTVSFRSAQNSLVWWHNCLPVPLSQRSRIKIFLREQARKVQWHTPESKVQCECYRPCLT